MELFSRTTKQKCIYIELGGNGEIN